SHVYGWGRMSVVQEMCIRDGDYVALSLIHLVMSFRLEKLLLGGERRLLRHEVPGSPERKTFSLQKHGSYRRMIAQMDSGKGGGG
ncbi:hypothetical protein AMQ83_12710, partial [Paenibacillus riograndensis]